MRTIKRLCSLIIGFIFFVAGILKLMDPVGVDLIVSEYLKFLHLGFLNSGAYLIASILSLLETITGIALMVGVWRRITAIISGIMLLFFTLLTIILVIVNPNMDCGCFGEAIHLTHAQSLIKNIFLCILWAIAFVPLQDVQNTLVEYVVFFMTSILCVFYLIYSLNSIPLVDFTPYSSGTQLAQVDENYSKDAPHLSFSNKVGEYVDSLISSGKVLISSVYEPEKLNSKQWARIAQNLKTADSQGYCALLLIASTPNNAKIETSDLILQDNVYFADRRTLMTLNRSNGGYTEILDGCIINKWPTNHTISQTEMATSARL